MPNIKLFSLFFSCYLFNFTLLFSRFGVMWKFMYITRVAHGELTLERGVRGVRAFCYWHAFLWRKYLQALAKFEKGKSHITGWVER